MTNHCFTADFAFFLRKDSDKPQSYLRRLLLKNSGVLCLATLITLPIIIGVAIGYVIILAFVTTYRKITGKKSREEKESEAAKKIRIVLGHELLDTAFTKPEELPAQKPRCIRQPSRYGSINDASNVTLSSDGNESESESETQTEDETIEQVDERNLVEKRSEKKDLHDKVEDRIRESQQKNSGAVIDVSAEETVSRATSASSGHYSTASEMTDGRDSREPATPAQDTSEYSSRNTQEENTCEFEVLEKITHDAFGCQNKTIPEVTSGSLTEHVTIEEGKFFDTSSPAVHSVKIDSGLLSHDTVPAKHSEIQDSGFQTAPTIHSTNQDSGLKPEKTAAVKYDCSPRTLTSSYHIEISPDLGKLKYSVHYVQERNELLVTIIKAINLFHEQNEPLPSCFVKVSLLPQRFCWQKTKVLQETRNPVFNETFVISGFSHERFSNYTLLICVVNAVAPWEGMYRDHVIGELYVPLSRVAKYSSNQEKVFSRWAELKAKLTETPNCSNCGKVNLALCYRPISGRLIVTIKKAKDLEYESKENFDPYVKLALYCSGSRVGRGNTRVKRKTSSPVFNEKFNFDLSADQIAYTTIVVKAMNNADDATSSCTGATVIGYESSGNGQEHWLCMMKSLSKHVDAWHTLYS